MYRNRVATSETIKKTFMLGSRPRIIFQVQHDSKQVYIEKKPMMETEKRQVILVVFQYANDRLEIVY